MANEGRFQVAVGAIIEGPDGKVLLIQRANDSDAAADVWEFPIGRLNQFEPIQDGLSREVAEETGIVDLEVFRPVDTFSYMRGGKTAEFEVKGINFWCRTDTSRVTLSNEHQAFQWLPIDEAINFVTHPGIKANLTNYRDISRLAP